MKTCSILALILLTTLACAPRAKEEQTQRSPADSGKPNIVLILADDLGWHQLGCYGSDYYETPVLDQLAAHGMRFTDAYAAQGVCSPSRASIMTGKSPARLHLTLNLPSGDVPDGSGPAWGHRKIEFPDPVEVEKGNIIIPAYANRLRLEEVTLAEQLKSAGYTTGHFGKWHLNFSKAYQPGRPGDPGSQGFDEVLTTHKFGLGPPSSVKKDPLHVQQITQRALAFIEANRNRPFFAYVTHNSIHRPEVADDELIQYFANKPGAKPGSTEEDRYDHNNPKQAAMLAELDASVGRILDKLEELKLLENTLVIFLSDNGQLGPKDSFPLRGSKADLYEGGIRVPMIIQWQGKVAANSLCSEPVITHDLFPTFNALARAGDLPENLDGMSLLPLLEDPRRQLDRNALYFHFPHDHDQGSGPMSVVRERQFKLIEFSRRVVHDQPGAYELYDLSKDLAERKDLASKNPELVNRLKAKLYRWRDEVGAQAIRKN